LEEIAMHRRPLVVPVLCLLFGALLGGLPALRTMAQDSDPAALGQGFVGSWVITFPGGGEGNQVLATLTSDGTYIDDSWAPYPAEEGAPNTFEYRSAGHGVWVATGERTADLTLMLMHSDENGRWLRTDTLNVKMTLSEDGETLHSDLGSFQHDAKRMHVRHD
jgi:hypothetical protein